VVEWGDLKFRLAQIYDIRNQEVSLAAGKPRALIQMATGGGRTRAASSFIYRPIKFAGVRRLMLLVDRDLGWQTKKELEQ
jgi:type I restriction enzyme R subunit